MPVEHRVTIALKVKSDEDAAQIERQVEALGYEILDVVETHELRPRRVVGLDRTRIGSAGGLVGRWKKKE